MTLRAASHQEKSVWRTWFRLAVIVGAILVIALGGLALSWRFGESEGGEGGEARKVWSGR